MEWPQGLFMNLDLKYPINATFLIMNSSFDHVAISWIISMEKDQTAVHPRIDPLSETYRIQLMNPTALAFALVSVLAIPATGATLLFSDNFDAAASADVNNAYTGGRQSGSVGNLQYY